MRAVAFGGAGMTKITISYRRHDSAAMTGWICERLVAYYGRDAVFRDIDNTPPGVDFRKYIAAELANTDVLLAIVGPQWTGPAPLGPTRIFQENDLVRIEVEAALKRGIPVVPVLVGGAEMPQPGDLPHELKDFSYRHAVAVDALLDFDDHVNRLIRSIDRLLKSKAAVTEEPITDAASVNITKKDD